MLQEADKIKEYKSVEEEKIDVNLSRLSKREKLKLLNEESPELLELVEDFKCKCHFIGNSSLCSYEIQYLRSNDRAEKQPRTSFEVGDGRNPASKSGSRLHKS